jgi:cobalt-precorrin 5A hydrolase
MCSSKQNKHAVWVITPNGVEIARKIADGLAAGSDVFVSDKLSRAKHSFLAFQSLSETVEKSFNKYDGHIFIMSAGIVVRIIAPLIRSKIEDPAIVVVDDRGKHAVSLLSGHIGGANDLTVNVAEIIGARPVITTATDVNKLVAVDVLAKEKKLFIESPQAIKTVNMALLNSEQIRLYDPFGLMTGRIPGAIDWPRTALHHQCAQNGNSTATGNIPGVYIDDAVVDLPAGVLILRPPTLIAGMGCNRNTPMEEMMDLLEATLDEFQLSRGSLSGLASINLKADESGLLALAHSLGLPLYFYDKQELNQVTEIKTPSLMVEKHIGVKSVCEAAAILAAQNGTLVVPKQTTRNVTVAIARIAFMS